MCSITYVLSQRTCSLSRAILGDPKLVRIRISFPPLFIDTDSADRTIPIFVVRPLYEINQGAFYTTLLTELSL